MRPIQEREGGDSGEVLTHCAQPVVVNVGAHCPQVLNHPPAVLRGAWSALVKLTGDEEAARALLRKVPELITVAVPSLQVRRSMRVYAASVQHVA